MKALSKQTDLKRTLKVHYAFYRNKYNNHYPVIRIAGKYLRSFGFEIGDTLQVQCSPGRITVSLAPMDQNK